MSGDNKMWLVYLWRTHRSRTNGEREFKATVTWPIIIAIKTVHTSVFVC